MKRIKKTNHRTNRVRLFVQIVRRAAKQPSRTSADTITAVKQLFSIAERLEHKYDWLLMRRLFAKRVFKRGTYDHLMSELVHLLPLYREKIKPLAA